MYKYKLYKSIVNTVLVAKMYGIVMGGRITYMSCYLYHWKAQSKLYKVKIVGQGLDEQKKYI